MEENYLCVEVCDNNGVYYPAYVLEVESDGLIVSYPNNWKPDRKIAYSEARLPYHGNTPITDYVENQEIEALSCTAQNEPCGWWRGRVKMVKGEFIVVEYGGNDGKFNEILPAENLRPAGLW
ncbi:fxr2 [Bugula neritina]|uniref:Fxr2 n=1 Tax=Bugula neritina TaxID=10212 RepID=A0A7J7KFA4_BUGNE|nr:fxr2 [Bugula neritina]